MCISLQIMEQKDFTISIGQPGQRALQINCAGQTKTAGDSPGEIVNLEGVNTNGSVVFSQSFPKAIVCHANQPRAQRRFPAKSFQSLKRTHPGSLQKFAGLGFISPNQTPDTLIQRRRMPPVDLPEALLTPCTQKLIDQSFVVQTRLLNCQLLAAR